MRVLRGFMKAFAIILCIVLFFTAFVAVTLTVVTDLVKVDTLRRVITEVDWMDMLGDGNDPADDYTYAAAAPHGLLAAPVRLLPAADLVSGEGLEDMLEGVDLEALTAEMEALLQSEEIETFFAYTEEFIEENGEAIAENLSDTDVETLLSTPTVEAMFKDVANEMFALLTEEDRSRFDLSRITGLVDKHADSFFEVLGVEKDEQFVELAKGAVGSVAEGIAESKVIPPAEKIMDVVFSEAMGALGNNELTMLNEMLGLPADASATETVAALRNLINTVVTALWVSVVVLVGLIALLWWHLFRWTLPVGITLLLSGGFSAAIGLLGKLVLNSAANVAGASGDTGYAMMMQLADVALLSRFTLFGGIVAGVGLLCIVAYIVLRIVLSKPAAPAEELPMPDVFKDSVKA